MKKIATILLLVVMVYCLTGCQSKAEAQRHKNELNEKQVEINNLKQEKKELEDEIASLTLEKNNLKVKLDNANIELDNADVSSSDDIEALKAENEKLKKQVSSASKQTIICNIAPDASSYFVAFAFPSDGKIYKASDDTVWYSNPYCSPQDKVLSKTTLISKKHYTLELDNTFKPYAFLNSNGVVVYTPKLPTLKVVK